jgi:uncharacterized protein with HEPN domain
LSISLSPLEYLRHILDETKYLAEKTSVFSHEQFLKDETAKRAFVLSIEIIGEATKKVPPELKQRYPDIDSIEGMRQNKITSYRSSQYYY